MIFYFLLLCSVICASACVSFAKDRGVVLISKFITFNLLFIPAALRYGIGVDYFDYVKIFNGLPAGRFQYIESGWRYLNLAVYSMGGSAQFLIALTAFFSLFFLFCDVENKKWFIYVPVCTIMIYMWLYTTLRQMLAMSMVFCAIQRVHKRKYIIAFLLAIGSIFFHKSVLLYIPIFCLCYFIRCKPLPATLLFFITIIITNFFAYRINDFFLNLIGFGSYSNYLTTNWIEPTEAGMGRFVRYLVHGIMLLFFPLEERKGSMLLSLFLLYCMIDCYALQLQIINRISRGILFLFMPMMWLIWKYKCLRQIRVFVYIICFFLLFLRNYNGAEYISIFN